MTKAEKAELEKLKARMAELSPDEEEEEEEDDSKDGKAIAIMSKAFEKALDRVAKKRGKKPPAPPEKGYFDSIMSALGIED